MMSQHHFNSQWTDEEDAKLKELVNKYGSKKWSVIAQELGTKGSKQCRRRWKNVIDNVNRTSGAWTPEEDSILLDGHRQFGNKWTEIAKRLTGRTDNAVKNRYHAIQKSRGLDAPGMGSDLRGMGTGHGDSRKRLRHDPDAPHYERMMKQRHGPMPGEDIVAYPNKPNLHIVPPDEAADAAQNGPRIGCMYPRTKYTTTEQQLLDEVNQMNAPMEFFPYDDRDDLDAKAFGNIDLLDMLSTPRFFAITPSGGGNDLDTSKALDDSIIWLRTGLTPRRGEAPTPAQQFGPCSGPALSPAHRDVLRKFFSSAVEGDPRLSEAGGLANTSTSAGVSIPGQDLSGDGNAGRGPSGIPSWPRSGTPPGNFPMSPGNPGGLATASPLDETAFRMLLDVLDDDIAMAAEPLMYTMSDAPDGGDTPPDDDDGHDDEDENDGAGDKEKLREEVPLIGKGGSDSALEGAAADVTAAAS